MPPGGSNYASRFALALSYVIEGGWLDDDFIDFLQRLRAGSNSSRRIAEWYGMLAQMEIFVPAKCDTASGQGKSSSGSGSGGDSRTEAEQANDASAAASDLVLFE